MSKLAWTRPEITEVIPDGVEYVEPEVRELAAGIAADIRTKGHYQCGRPGGVCIVTSPTWKSLISPATVHILERFSFLLCGGKPGSGDVPDFNDDHPTSVVLARLDAIAEGLVER